MSQAASLPFPTRSEIGCSHTSPLPRAFSSTIVTIITFLHTRELMTSMIVSMIVSLCFTNWLTMSCTAKGACEVLWSGLNFNNGFYFESGTIIDPHATPFLRTYQGEAAIRKSVGIPIDLRQCVREIRLYTNSNPTISPTHQTTIQGAC